MTMKGFSALGMALALVACGGGGSNNGPSQGGGGGGTPTPTPTPTVSYTKFDSLTAPQTFQSACADSRRRGPTFNGTLATDFGAGLTFAYTPAEKKYVVGGDGLDLTFLASNIVFEDANGRRYEKPNAFSTGGTDFLSVYNPGYAVVATQYGRFGTVQTIREDGTTHSYRCVFGVTTELNDKLPTGTKTYSQMFNVASLTQVIAATGGSTSTQANLGASVSTLSANPTTGKVDFQVQLKSTSGGTTTDYFTVKGTDTIDGSTKNFSGTLVDASNNVVGYFGGWFFGPKGEEVGIAWNVNTRLANDDDFFVYGMTLGSNP